MSIKEEKRTMRTDADMEQFFKELVPHLDGIEDLMKKYEGEHTVNIQVSADGYVRAGVYSTGFEITKFKQDPYKVRKEYTFSAVLGEVG